MVNEHRPVQGSSPGTHTQPIDTSAAPTQAPKDTRSSGLIGRSATELHPTLTRRRRAGADPERADGVVRATGTSLRPLRNTLTFAKATMPVTTSVALLGDQLHNVDTAGPVGKLTPPKWAPLDAAQFQIVVPPPHLRESAAQEAIQAARDVEHLLTGAGAPADSAPAKGSLAGRVIKAPVQLVGLAQRPAAALDNVIALRKAGQGGNPDPLQHHAMAAVTGGKVKLANATWAAATISLQFDRVAAYIKASHDEAMGTQIDDFVHQFRALAKEHHDAQARLDAPMAGDDPAQAQRQANQAQQNFDSHRSATPDVAAAWKKPLQDMLTLQSSALKAVAGHERTLATALRRIRAMQESRLQELVDNPPGVQGSLPAFTTVLAALKDLLLQAPHSMTAVAADDVMELTLAAAVQAFGNPGVKHNTNQALRTLAHTRVDDLGALIAAPRTSTATAATLAVAIGRLPRGAELLSRLCGSPSSFLEPPPASSSKEDKAAAKELGSRRAVALRNLCIASSALQHPGTLDAESRNHLRLARDAALAALQSPRCNVAELPDEQRHAFNCVRNQFHDMGPDSVHAEAVKRLRQVAGPMLTSQARKTTFAGTVARYNPAADATPFNPAAMEAAATALRQGRLIGTSIDTVRDLRTAADGLRDGAAASTEEKALKAMAGVVLGAVTDARPERIGKLTASDVHVPQRFGLSETDLRANPRLAALWQRYEKRDTLDHIANTVDPWLHLRDTAHQQGLAKTDVPAHFGLGADAVAADPRLDTLWNDFNNDRLSPAETASRLARIARDDLFSASLATPVEVLRDLATITSESLQRGKATEQDKNASDAVKAFRKSLDSARAAGIWENPQINSPQELADGIAALYRVQRLRSRAILKGDQTFGVDLGKFAGSVAFEGPLSMNFRLNAGGKFQTGFNLEFGLSTSSYYAIIGQQRAAGAKAGVGAGASASGEWEGAGQPFTAGTRFADVSATGSAEYQWQEGLRVLIPRDKSTEERNLEECVQAMRHMVMGEEFGYPDPAQAIMTNVDAASLNVLGNYDRTALRAEATGGAAPLQVGLSRLQLRLAETFRTSAETKWGELREVSGYFKVQDIRIDHATQQTATHAAMATVQAGRWKLGDTESTQSTDTTKSTESTKSADSGGKSMGLSLSDMASWSKEGKNPHQDYVILRMVTMDDELLAKRSRLIQAFSHTEPYVEVLKQDRARWIQFGAEYSKFPEGFTDQMKLQASERDFDTWIDELKQHHTRFSEYGVVKCLQDEVPAPFDTMMAKLAQAESGSQREKDLNAQANQLLGDGSSWEPRRSSNNMTSVQASRPGYVLGLVAGSGGDMYVIDNLQLLPRA